MEKSPFREPLKRILDENIIERGGAAAFFEQIGENQNFFVRQKIKISSPEDMEILMKRAEIWSNLNNFHLNVPVHFVIGHEKNKKVLFIITDVISGTPLDKKETINDANFDEKLGRFHENLIDYFDTIVRSRSTFVSDITKPEQSVYGHKHDIKSNDIYLVDVDLFKINSLQDFGVNNKSEFMYYWRALSEIKILTEDVSTSYKSFGSKENAESIIRLYKLVEFIYKTLRKIRSSDSPSFAEDVILPVRISQKNLQAILLQMNHELPRDII